MSEERTIQEKLREIGGYFSRKGMPCNSSVSEQAADRIDALERALGFYATAKNYHSELKFAACDHRIGWEKTPVLVDGGSIAIAALHPSDNETGGVGIK